jgi:hypothetical protein
VRSDARPECDPHYVTVRVAEAHCEQRTQLCPSSNMDNLLHLALCFELTFLFDLAYLMVAASDWRSNAVMLAQLRQKHLAYAASQHSSST